MKIIILLMALLTISTTATADCFYNGQAYPSGTVIGPYICSGNQWVNK